MTAPVVYLVPHGEPGHFESRACGQCRAFLEELAHLDRQMLDLCALGLAEVVSTDHRGERSYRLTPDGHDWLPAADAAQAQPLSKADGGGWWRPPLPSSAP